MVGRPAVCHHRETAPSTSDSKHAQRTAVQLRLASSICRSPRAAPAETSRQMPFVACLPQRTSTTSMSAPLATEEPRPPSSQQAGALNVSQSRASAPADPSNISAVTAAAAAAAATPFLGRKTVMFPSHILEQRVPGPDPLRVQEQASAAIAKAARMAACSMTATSSSSLQSNNNTKKLSPMAEWAKLFDDNDDDFNSDSDTLSETETDTDNDDDEGSDSEEETAVAQALVRAAFGVRQSGSSSSSSSTSSLSRLLGAAATTFTTSGSLKRDEVSVSASSDGGPKKKPRFPGSMAQCGVNSYSSCEEQQEAASEQLRMRLSSSAPVLLHQAAPQDKKTTSIDAFSNIKPDDYLSQLLLPKSTTVATDNCSEVSTTTQQHCIKYYKASELTDFFIPLPAESLAAYDTALVQAVRRQDVDALRTLQRQGHRLHAGNAFGETVLHAAARRGATSVVRFLLEECRVPVRVCCDYGRTVLHDACWTVAPNWACIELLLDACPDLLFVQDCRGSTPLQYVPKEHWGDWCRFLRRRHLDQRCDDGAEGGGAAAAAESNKSKLVPHELQVISDCNSTTVREDDEYSLKTACRS